MHKFLKIFRFLLAIEAMRRAWKKFHPIRILKFIGVIALGLAALAIVVTLLKKLGDEKKQTSFESRFEPPKPKLEAIPAPEPKARPEPKPVPEPKAAPEPKPVPEPKAAPEPETESAPANEAGACPPSHPVKAVNRSKIYHTAESRWYERSKADICFRDVAAAEAAGFRAPGKTPK